MTEPEQHLLSRLDVFRGMERLIWSGALSSVYSSVTAGAILTGYALYLGATNYQIGLLGAVPGLGQVIQMFSPFWLERMASRKPVCVHLYTLARALWVPIAVIPWLVPKAWWPWTMIALTGLSGLVLGIPIPAGSSWTKDLIPETMRGRYYARQNAVLSIVGLVSGILAGRYVDVVPRPFGFSSVIIAATAFGLVSAQMLRWVPEPPKPTTEPLALSEFLTLPFRHRNFRNLMMVVSLRTLCVMIAAPFFSVFMIKELHISQFVIALFTAVVSISMAATNSFWGYLSDKFGHRPVFNITYSGIAFIPLVWTLVLPSNWHWTIPLFYLYSGFMVAGLSIAQFNLVITTSPQERSSAYIGCYSAMVGVASAIGPMIGGWVAELTRHWDLHLLNFELTGVRWVFLASFCARFMSLGFLGYIRERRSRSAGFVLQQVATSGNPIRTFWNIRRLRRTADESAKVQATRALASDKASLAVEELVEAMDDSSWEVRREAARALGEIGDSRAVRPLRKKVSDPSADIREEAAVALGKLSDPRSLNSLADLLFEQESSLRKSAAIALGELGDPRAVPALAEAAGRERDPTVFLAIAEALSRTGHHMALHRLRAMLARSHPGPIRKQLANTLAAMLDSGGAFYALLHMEELEQANAVARSISGARKTLLTGHVPESDRLFIRALAEEAVDGYGLGDYPVALGSLRRAMSRTLRSFASGGEGPRYLRHKGRDCDASTPLKVRVGRILATDDKLRLSYGVLRGLAGEARRRPLSHEEALLGIFAFHHAASAMSAVRQWQQRIARSERT